MPRSSHDELLEALASTDFSVSFGGFKQSGIGREGIHEGLPHFLETKFVILEGHPAGYENTEL